MEWYTAEIQKVLVAAALGAVVGLEREWSGKPAGLRTLVLVSAGAALFTIVSYELAGLDTFEVSDLTRVASNIVTGIGFIGAGIIFRGKGGVQGLTTAATVWICAAIGMVVGVGNYVLACASTVIVWLVLVGLQYLEYFLIRITETYTYKVRFHPDEHKVDVGYEDYFQGKDYKLRETKYHKNDSAVTVYWTVSASRKNHKTAINKLICDKAIEEMEYG